MVRRRVRATSWREEPAIFGRNRRRRRRGVGSKAENTGEAVNDDVTAVKDARESNVDAGDGDRGGGGGSAVGEVEAAVREERGESVAVGEEAELGEGEAERDDVETESVGVRRGR